MLHEAELKSKVGFLRRVICERLYTRFYVSREMALYLLNEKHIGNKSGVEGEV
jgi:hypothetical protein